MHQPVVVMEELPHVIELVVVVVYLVVVVVVQQDSNHM